MLRTIVGLVLVIAGIWTFTQGWSRKHSIAGSLAETGTQLANAFDGRNRTARHYLYLGGGTILAAGGVVLIVAGRGKR